MTFIIHRILSAIVLFIFMVCCTNGKKESQKADDNTLAKESAQPQLTTATSSDKNQILSEQSIIIDSTTGLGDRPEWNKQVALEMFYAPDSVPSNITTEMFESGLLSSTTGDNRINILNSFVQFINENTSPEGEMYPRYCPSIAVYSWDTEGNLVLITSQNLECYTNYDDSFVDLQLEPLRLGEVDVVMLTATGSGGSSESESSATNVFLYALVNGSLVEVLTLKTGESQLSSEEDDNYDRSWEITVSEQSTNSVRDLIYTLISSSDLEQDTDESITYRWTGERFE